MICCVIIYIINALMRIIMDKISAGTHASIEINNNSIVIICDDYEVFDYISDVIIERSEKEIVNKTFNNQSENTWQMIISNKDNFEEVIKIFKGLDVSEIDRIYQINN